MGDASDRQKHVVVIGAGLAGLAACYDLTRAGMRVTVLEASPDYGGLASSLVLEGMPVERFYHFVCRADDDLVRLVEELGLSGKLSWKNTRTAFYHNGRHYSFGTPLDLLRFSAVPPLQRLRFGYHVFRSRYRRQWRQLDAVRAKPWLIQNIGEEAYRVIWDPLLRIKFGTYHDRISAAWIWHRIWRVATSRRRAWSRELFGCLEHGSATLVEELVRRLREHPAAELRSGVRVRGIDVGTDGVRKIVTADREIPCDAVISTVALPVLLRLLPEHDDEYFRKLREVRYIGVVVMLLSLERPFSPNFWLNINDPRICFNGVIEQSNLNDNLRAAGLNVLYVPFYLPTDEPRYRYPDEQLFDEYTAMLALVRPGFERSQVREYHVSRTAFAQAVCTTGFAALVPDHRAPVRGLYVTDSTQFYPEDRTISAAIRQGRTAARAVVEDLR